MKFTFLNPGIFSVYILFVVTLYSTTSIADIDSIYCGPDEYTYNLPFLVVSKDKLPNTQEPTNNSANDREADWENFVEDGKNTSYIKRGSIVYVPFINEGNPKVEVQVLSVPDDKIEEGIKTSERVKKLYEGTEDKKAARVGMKASIDAEALVSAGEFIYMIKKDTDAKIIKEFGLENFSGVEFFKTNKGYAYRHCCTRENGEIANNCFQQYLFNIKGSDSQQVYLDPNSCNFLMSPLPKDDYEAIYNIIKETELFLDDIFPLMADRDKENNLGSIKEEPGRPFMVKMKLNVNPYGNQSKDKGSDKEKKFNEENYLAPWTLCGLKKMIDTFYKICDPKVDESCKISLGDCYSEIQWKPHKTHYSGQCFDMLPAKKLLNAGKKVIYDYTYDILKIISSVDPSSVVYYNDKKLLDKKKELKLTKFSSESGHNDHLHVCFTPDSQAVRNACKDDGFEERISTELSKLPKGT